MKFNFSKNFKYFFKLWKKHWQLVIVVLIAFLFFLGTSSYSYFTQSDGFVKWSSPDETANYVFTKYYGQTGEFSIYEGYNLYTNDIMHPRSFRSDHGNLKPVSFLGIIIIFGYIVSFTTYKIIPYLTPFFASIAIIYYYLLIKKIFGKRNAFYSTLFLAVLPPFVYYSARSMFHNVLFVSLLLIGLYYAVLMVKHKRKMKVWRVWGSAALAGVFAGLAVATRTSELLWILPFYLVLFLFNFKKVYGVKLVLFFGFLIFSLIPFFCANKILYDSPWQGGYPEMNQSIASITRASTDIVKNTAIGELAYHRELWAKIKSSIFFFGIHPEQSLKMFYYYFASMLYYLFWPALFGFVIFLSRIDKWKKRHWVYIISCAIFSVILLFYYGSWKFHDNPDPRQFTIGNSYTRYWLPIYMAAIPFAILFMIRITHLARKKIFIVSLRSLIIGLLVSASLTYVAVGSAEGLVYTAQKRKQDKVQWEKVLNLTEHNSTIITEYHDKLFFPERKVIVGLFNDDQMISEYANLVKYLPVYYYNFTFPQDAVDYLNNSKLRRAGLGIEEVSQVTGDFTLYRLFERIETQEELAGGGEAEAK